MNTPGTTAEFGCATVLAAPSEVGSKTILLVDDDEEVRALLQSALESWGYQVIVARDGRNALRHNLMHATDIDLLLTDIVMPGMSGVDVAREVAQWRPGIKQLYISGYAAYAVLYCGLPLDVTLLQKPIRLATLRSAIATALASGQPH